MKLLERIAGVGLLSALFVVLFAMAAISATDMGSNAPALLLAGRAWPSSQTMPSSPLGKGVTRTGRAVMP